MTPKLHRQRPRRRPFAPCVEVLEDRATPAAFTPGNLVVYRVGDGVSQYGPGNAGASAPAFLDEYTTAGVLVQSIALSAAPSGSNHAITNTIDDLSEGLLTRSANGRYLTVGGYDAAVYTPDVAGSGQPRTLARIDWNGTADTSRITSAHSGGTIRGVASFDGQQFWSAGDGGVVFHDASGNPSVTGRTDSCGVTVGFDNRLYFTSGSDTPGVYTFSTALPVAGSGEVGIAAGGDFAPTGLVLLDMDLDNRLSTGDRLYYADLGNNRSLNRLTWNGGAWADRTSFDPGVFGLYGLTGRVVNGQAVLYGTTAGITLGATSSFFTNIQTLTDTGPGSTWGYLPVPAGYGGAGSIIAAATFRGIALVPSDPGVASITSTTPDEAYGVGSTVNVTVNFTQPVTLLTGSLTIPLDSGGSVTFGSFTTATRTLSGTYTVGAGDSSADLDAISPLVLSSGRLRDAGGVTASLTVPAGQSLAASKNVVIDGVAPTIQSITSADPDGSYGLGSTVDLTINFTEPVTLEGGDLILQLDTGATVRISPFANSATAHGTYTVGANESSSDLGVTGVSLESGATLRDGVGNNASLDLPTGSSLADLKNLVIDSAPPTVASVTSTSANGRYGVGSSVNVTVNFSEPISLQGGSLTVQLDSGGSVVFTSLNNTNRASGTYTVAPNHNSGDLDSTALVLSPGATLLDAAGNPIDLTSPAGASLADLKNLAVGIEVPAVTRVTSTSPDGMYRLGDAIDVTVSFSEPVTLQGGDLIVNLSTGATVRISSITNATTAQGTYTVAAGHLSGDLGVSSITLSEGATLRNAAGVAANLNVPRGESLADLKNLVIDGVPPQLTRVTSTSPNGVYGPGESVNVTVEFGERVTLSGGPLRIDLSGGGFVTIHTINNAATAAGVYTVGPGQNSGDLDSTELSLSTGATLRDAAGNDAVLSIPAGQSLAALKNLVIDTTAPTVTGVTSSTPDGTYGPGASVNVTVHFSEPVTLVGGPLTLALDSGGTVAFTAITNASSASGTYTVAAGQNSLDLDSTALALALASSLRDAAGNDADLAIPSAASLATSKALVIDTTGPRIARVTSSTPDGSYAAGNVLDVTLTFTEPATLSGGTLLVELDTGDTLTIDTINNATTVHAAYPVPAGRNSPRLNVVSLTLSTGATLRDARGNDAFLGVPPGDSLGDNRALVIDTTAPAVASVSALSPDGVYGAGDSVQLVVTFTEPVSLTGGSLRVALDTGAELTLGPIDNTTTATAVYLVRHGQNSPDLNSVALTFVGGVLRDAAGNTTSSLPIPSGQSIADLKNLVVDTNDPSVLGVTSTTPDGLYGIGAVIDVTVNFSEPVTLTGGTLTLQLDGGGQVVFDSVTNAAQVHGIYTVAANQASDDLDSLALTLSSAAVLRDADGKPARLGIPSDATLARQKNLVVDGVRPVLDRVTSTTPDGSYRAGDVVDVTLEFSELVTLAGGTLELTLDTGTVVTFQPAATTRTVLGTYTIAAGQTSADLDSSAVRRATGAAVRDAAGNAASLDVLPGASLAGSNAIVIDTTAPTVIDVTSATPDGAYRAGDEIDVTLTFSEAVTLAGGPLRVAFDTGAVVSIVSVNGTTAHGVYTVGAGENSPDLTVVGLALAPGATLRDAARNDAGLALPEQPNGDGRTLVLDTIAPTFHVEPGVAVSSSPVLFFSVVFSEPVQNFDASDVTLTGTAGATGLTVTPSGNGTTFTLAVSGMIQTGTVIPVLRIAAALDAAGNATERVVGEGGTYVAPAPVPPPRSVTASLVTRKVRGQRVRVVQVRFADTNAVLTEFLAPFQTTRDAGLVATAVDTDGDGAADAVLVRARRGKRRVQQIVSVR